MWQFISDNSAPLNTIANALMLVVWALYFQLLLNAHRRQRRAKVLINRSAGHDLSSNCVVSNMSAEPVYLESVVVTTERDGERSECSLTDLDTLTRQPGEDPRRFWFQGPLMTGEYITLGSFETLLSSCCPKDCAPTELSAFEIMVVATYGPDHAPVGTRRRFRRVAEPGANGGWTAEPAHQIRSFWHRRALRAYLRDA
ncbi:hypothetical protein N1F89_10670 [Aquibium sp. A9E412]|uniref:hypothetical protein n=1 Tax=Aquibium sp. A9E412 TaxID=2976767 RepID=UPI0025B274D6|nr:hypothetical protein [Aquibium sp. A9E412]MDN2566686.1 hypothetical protein [Aquibium sp. A9E412]